MNDIRADKPSFDHGPIVQAICSVLRRNSWLMGTAESCTGGGIAKVITDTPGVSDVFAGGVVVYSNQLKNQLLGVKWDTLNNDGAVSFATATEMVLGLVRRFNLHVGISVTGIAGPGGGSADKPVGLIYIATYVYDNCKSSEHHFPGDRLFVRDQTVITSLGLLREHLFDYEKPLNIT